jgi:hypothetical protein
MRVRVGVRVRVRVTVTLSLRTLSLTPPRLFVCGVWVSVRVWVDLGLG